MGGPGSGRRKGSGGKSSSNKNKQVKSKGGNTAKNKIAEENRRAIKESMRKLGWTK
jgi:hypothetical protein